MRLWLSRRSEVPIREQFVTQIMLGILSDELAPGERLPSTRELARRFKVHANTISGAYRELERDKWVEFRHGSGVYVRKGRPVAEAPQGMALDQLIANFLREARSLGAPLEQVRARMRHWLRLQPPDHFLVIEPDPELRAIVVAEVAAAADLRVVGCDIDEGCKREYVLGAIALVLPSKFELVSKRLPVEAECLMLHVRSVPTSLAERLPAPKDALIGIASRWQQFLISARTMLLAAGFDADSLVVRDAKMKNWKNGLTSMSAVVCDTLTARELPKQCRAIVFPLLAERSLEDLRQHHETLGDGKTQTRTRRATTT